MHNLCLLADKTFKAPVFSLLLLFIMHKNLSVHCIYILTYLCTLFGIYAYISQRETSHKTANMSGLS